MFESLPSSQKPLGLFTETPAAYPHLCKFVFNAHRGNRLPAMQFPFYSSAIFLKKTTTKNTTNKKTHLIFKSESFPPPNLSSPTDKGTMYMVSVITMISFSFYMYSLQSLYPQIALAVITYYCCFHSLPV